MNELREASVYRHPIQEVCCSPFVPNDTLSNTNNGKMKVLTGPNASGKSVYLKQVTQSSVRLQHIISSAFLFVKCKSGVVSFLLQYIALTSPNNHTCSALTSHHSLLLWYSQLTKRVSHSPNSPYLLHAMTYQFQFNVCTWSLFT